MKYVFVIYNDERRLGALSRDSWVALADEALAYAEELRRKGCLLAAQDLQGGQAATTVRVRNGHVVTTEGPVASAKEQLGGFMLIEARDLNEAIQLASRMPQARVGSIEVRPIRESDPRTGGRAADE